MAGPTTDTAPALRAHRALVDGLRRELARDAPVASVETHISTVLLAGEYAYKLKKPVALGFLDFTGLDSRRRYCEEELRLNRRTASALYLDVVPITGTPDVPVIGGAGPALDYAVRMRRFPADALAACMAARGALGPAEAAAIARAVAAFHRDLPSIDERSADPGEHEAGAPQAVIDWARDNFAALAALPLDAPTRLRLDALAHWTDTTFDRRTHQFAARRHGGFIRECHGDLHLGNVVWIEGGPVLFDAIEFSPALRRIDVMSDAAFTFMDLLDHGLAPAAWRFLNEYVEATGDFSGLATLTFYAVYRAMVRAKVHLMHALEPGVASTGAASARSSFAHYLALAERLAAPRPAVLVAMHGLAGSGKSTVAGALAGAMGAVRLRSDVERKRLYGLAPGARSGSGISSGMYGATASERTYERLESLAAGVLDAGHPVIVDATCLRRSDRDRLRAVARAAGARFALVECAAPLDVLRARVTARAAEGIDPSEADVRVLEAQHRSVEPIAHDERAETWVVATDAPAKSNAARTAEIARELGIGLAAFPARPGEAHSPLRWRERRR